MSAQIIRPLAFRPYWMWLVLPNRENEAYYVDYVTEDGVRNLLQRDHRMVRRPFSTFSQARDFIITACPEYENAPLPIVNDEQEAAAC